ncbi:MAG: threonine synthase [Halobacteriaceae archaeon]
METTSACTGLTCTECDASHDPDPAAGRCPECGGILDPTYDYASLSGTPSALGFADGPDSMYRYDALLPFPASASVTMAEGATPLVDCPSLADEVGVGRLLIKDEGRNPTGTFKDRGATVAVTAAAMAGASDVALPSAGNAGQAAAAYAGRAGLDAHVFLPSRAGFDQKAMVNVHGADLTVVEGRLPEAADACADAVAEASWTAIGSFETPYRHEGKKTMFYEVARSLDWTAPDAVVYPTGGGVGLVGVHKAARELERLGVTDDLPRLYAAQAAGCAPIARAVEEDREQTTPWETPDTICGGIEVPDPAAGSLVLDAVRASGGGAVATDDDAILESACTAAASAGVEMGAPCAAALSGAEALAADDELGTDDTVVVLNTGSANKDTDVLRSHLMKKGI